MRWIAVIALILTAYSLRAQNIVLAGGIFNADTTEITVYHLGDVISRQRVVSPAYTLVLGQKQFYTIRFSAKGKQSKYLHFFCYNITEPTVITQDVRFNNRTNVILWMHREKKRGRELEEYRTIWGEHSTWKEEF